MVDVQGRSPNVLLWGEEGLTLDHFLSFIDYFATAEKELSCEANRDRMLLDL